MLLTTWTKHPAVAEPRYRKAGMTEDEIRRAFHEHKDAVYNFALRLTGSRSVAEDLAQDCFVELLRNPSAYVPQRGSMRVFLIGVTRNLVHRRWRQERPTEAIDDDALIAVPDMISGSISNHVQAAVQSLPPLQREAVLLFEYQGFSLEEIAAVVGTDIGTVKSRLHRARSRLRRILAPLRSHAQKPQ